MDICKATQAKLLRTLATELENALTTFEGACECGICGPCKRQPRMRSLIKRARSEADEMTARRKR